MTQPLDLAALRHHSMQFWSESSPTILALIEEIERLNERLENNHVYGMDGKRKEVEPGSIPDGIECRDETIKLQQERIKELAGEVERLRAEVSSQQTRYDQIAPEWYARGEQIERLREALKPFRELHAETVKPWPGEITKRKPRPDDQAAWGFNNTTLNWGHFNRAASALATLDAALADGGEG